MELYEKKKDFRFKESRLGFNSKGKDYFEGNLSDEIQFIVC